MNKKSFFSGILKFGTSVLLITWLIRTGRLPVDELSTLFSAKVAAWGLLMVGAALFLASERWRMLLRSQGFHAKSGAAFAMTLIGTFFSFFLPGGVGGDIIKAYYVVQKLEKHKVKAVATVLFDRILGLFTMVIMAFFACFLEPGLLAKNATIQALAVTLGLLALGFTIAFFVMWSNSAGGLRQRTLRWTQSVRVVNRNLSRLYDFQLTFKQLVGVVLLSLVGQSVSILFFVGISFFLGFEGVPLLIFLFVVPLGFIAQAIPISPGGVGVGQAAFFFLFNLALGTETQVGSITVTAFQAFTFFYGLIGAGLYAFIRQHHGFHHAPEQSPTS
ncbi:MAG: lysylphosphatidylglycerol synthetase family protein [Bdellovibrio sp.]|nr:MAG: lysylphosphatidylglycerol synthetase family protein [Bdellovibrio sp.]